MSNYNSQLQSNNTDLQTVLQTLQTKAAAGQATPVISVNASGLITATAGTKSATKQLAFQSAKTITPSTVDQVAVSSGYYTGGIVTVKGDSNLVASNIVSGKTIFGVTGTATTGGGGDTSAEDGLITRAISSYTNDRVTKIGSYAFYYCPSLKTVSFPQATTIYSNAFYYCTSLTSASVPQATTIDYQVFGCCYSLKTVSFPQATTIGSYAFCSCSSLTSVSFPQATTIGNRAFCSCSSLTSVNFPQATTIGSSAFERCPSLTSVSFPQATTIGGYAFLSCVKLTSVSFPQATTIGSYAFLSCVKLISLYLTGPTLCKLSKSNAFLSTPIGDYSTSAGTYGSIYVPASLLASYKAATNWAYFSSRFVGI